MTHIGYVLSGYLLTFAVIALYIVRVRARTRSLASALGPTPAPSGGGAAGAGAGGPESDRIPEGGATAR